MKIRWVLGTIALVLSVSLTEANEINGFDCWALGMTKDEVKACTKRGPYIDVKVTGGLETANGDFEGTRTTVSFVFQDDRLAKIQIWLGEQTDVDTAVAAATRAWQYFVREFGPIVLAGTSFSPDATVDEFKARAHALAAGLSPDKQDRFQLAPLNRPAGASVWTSLARDPKYGYYVFLFVAKP